MAEHEPAPLTTNSTPQERDRTFRRVVLRIVPFITVVYVIAWMDRVNVGFAKLTMLDDLSWSEAIYGAGAGIFFLGYFLFEVPSNLLLEKIGARRTIMRIALGWGVVSVLMAWVTQPWHFYVLRFLQGAFEAGLHPGIILYLTYWLPAHRRGKAVAICMSASPLALLIGSPLAGNIMKYTDGMLGGRDWQWLFIIEGIPSVILGILAYFLLTDRPKDATWLSAEEHAHVAYELGKEAKELSGRDHSVRGALRSRTTWILILSLFCIITGNATLSFYGPSLVADVGFSDLAELGWIMSGIFAFGWLGMLVNGWWSDRRREARRHAALAAGVGALGLALAAVAEQQGSAAGLLAALALSAAGTMGAIPVFWSLPPRFMSGTALAAGVALINSCANLAGYFSPQFLGSVKESTGSYTTGLFVIAGVELIAVVLIFAFIKKEPATGAEAASPGAGGESYPDTDEDPSAAPTGR
ncbi:MFS transporter [Streptomyces sp. NPDC046821]|uniref:MFS transporter n=1 Tax=Streptomyces sp. NPDC046821 TaxID=3154702 RepID=UPI00340AE96B